MGFAYLSAEEKQKKVEKNSHGWIVMDVAHASSKGGFRLSSCQPSTHLLV